MLAHPELPPGLIEPCLDVLKEISPSERELIRVIVEIVVDLRDDDDNEIAEVSDINLYLDLQTRRPHRAILAGAIRPKPPSARRARCAVCVTLN